MVLMGARSARLGVGPSGMGFGSASCTGRVGGGKRGKIIGWSRGSSARHLRFLQEVDGTQLNDLHGYALTFTVRDLPTCDEWLFYRRELLMFLKERFELGHWVTELQARGVPHLHIAVYALDKLSSDDVKELIFFWCVLTAKHRSKPIAQWVDVIKPGDGWSKYCAKHASRSVRHYQREGLPPGWSRSGRLWGKWGDWPTNRNEFLLSPSAAILFRRLARAWAVKQAKLDADKLANFKGTKPNYYGVKAAKRLTRRDPALWAVQGFRLWIPQEVVINLLQACKTLGYKIWRVLKGEDVLYHEINSSYSSAANSVDIDSPGRYPKLNLVPF